MIFDKVEAEIRAEEYAEWLKSDKAQELEELRKRNAEAKLEYMNNVNRPVWNDNIDEQGVEPDPRIDPIIVTTVDGLPRLARWDSFSGGYRVEGLQISYLIKAPEVRHWYPVYPESEMMPA